MKRIILGAGALTLAGCHYYEVLDARTGERFYTEQWVAADGYRGPLTFEDPRGETVKLPQTIVTRISRDDFMSATSEKPDPGTEPKTPAKPR